MNDLCRWARRFDADAILQLGDNACLWPNRYVGQKLVDGFNQSVYAPVPHTTYWLDKMENVLSQMDVPMYFLDGNHEWFDAFEEVGIDIDGEDFVPVSDHITYLPRGFAWEWDGVRFLSLGGAVSADQEARQEVEQETGKTWFCQEELTDAQVQRAASRGKVDVMLCHDTVQMPTALMWHLRSLYGVGAPKLNAKSKRHREMVSYVARRVRPRFLYHGHYHFPYTEDWEGIHVRGLDRDGTGMDSIWLFDTEDYKRGDQR